MNRLTRAQSVTLVLLRTLIGWHFLYEGYYKVALPGWSAAGAPLASWSASGYLKAASGPFASWFHAMAASGASGWVDILIPVALAIIGLSLVLGISRSWAARGRWCSWRFSISRRFPRTASHRPGPKAPTSS